MQTIPKFNISVSPFLLMSFPSFPFFSSVEISKHLLHEQWFKKKKEKEGEKKTHVHLVLMSLHSSGLPAAANARH